MQRISGYFLLDATIRGLRGTNARVLRCQSWDANCDSIIAVNLQSIGIAAFRDQSESMYVSRFSTPASHMWHITRAQAQRALCADQRRDVRMASIRFAKSMKDFAPFANA